VESRKTEAIAVDVTPAYFAMPRRKSRADAVVWTAARIQDGATRSQILKELMQDGIPAYVAEDVHAEVLASFRTELVPRGAALLRVVLAVVCAAAMVAWVWSRLRPVNPAIALTAGEYGGDLIVATVAAFLAGVVVMAAALLASRGVWSFTLLSLVLAADVAAFVSGSDLVGHGPAPGLTAVGIAFAALGSNWALRKGGVIRFAAVMQGDRIRWRRVQAPPTWFDDLTR
jgi:hypothetical protein